MSSPISAVRVDFTALPGSKCLVWDWSGCPAARYVSGIMPSLKLPMTDLPHLVALYFTLVTFSLARLVMF